MTSYTDEILKRSYSRRGFIAAAGATALLAACGGDDDEADTGAADTGAPAQLEGTLVYYNWVGYVNPVNYKRFTEETGVEVEKDFYESNEELQAKLQAGARGYDLVVPTNYMVAILAEADLLTPIDYGQLPNVESNLDARFQGLPEERFSVPKDWGTTGFMYRTDLVKERPTTWKEFFELAKGPYSGKVTVLDGIPEVIGSTLAMLGYSYNSDDEGELNEAKDELLALKPHLQAITSTNYRQSLIAGKTVMALGWNGDGVAVADAKPAEYVVAEEGGEFWVDAYCIPVGNKNPDAAHGWINYIYVPENGAADTAYTFYASPLKRELLEPVLDPEILNNPAVFPPPELVENLEPNAVTPEGTALRDQIWTEFKAA